MEKRFKQWAIYIFFMSLVAALTFGNLRNHLFAYDDEDYIKNASLAQKDFSYIFSPAFDKPWASRVGAHFVFYLLYKIFREDPSYYHIVNVLIHLINCLLLAWFVSLLSNSLLIGFTAGFLFLLNCTHFRATYWISAISLLLGTTFVLLSLIFFQKYLEERKVSWLIGSSLLFAPAMLLHQSMVIAILFPIVLMLQKERRVSSSLLKVTAPFFLTALAFFSIDRYVYKSPFSGQETYNVGAHILINFAKYLFGLLVNSHSGIVEAFEVKIWMIVCGFLVFIPLLVLIQRGEGTRLWSLWILLTITPYALWERDYVLSRYFYLPAMGSSALIALLFWWIWRKFPPREVGRALVFLILGLIGVSSFFELKKLEGIQYWDSGKYYLLEKRNPTLAASELKKSLKHYPGQPSKVYLTLALAYSRQGLDSEAEKVLKDLIERDYNNPKAHLFLGNIYWSRGMLGRASAEIQKAFELDPRDEEIQKAFYRLRSLLRYGQLGARKGTNGRER